MSMFTYTALMFTVSLSLYFCLRQYSPLLAIIMLLLIPAVYIILMTKPDEVYDLSELPLVGENP